MIVNGIQCDACTKIHEMDIVRDKLHNDWFEIKKGNGRYMHFCSFHCLHEWVEKQIIVVENANRDRESWRDN